MPPSELTHEVETGVSLHDNDWIAKGTVTLVDCDQMRVAHADEPWDAIEIHMVCLDEATAFCSARKHNIANILEPWERRVVERALYEAAVEASVAR
jgi:hypothetical protein